MLLLLLVLLSLLPPRGDGDAQPGKGGSAALLPAAPAATRWLLLAADIAGCGLGGRNTKLLLL
jgi:hypothetical protein